MLAMVLSTEDINFWLKILMVTLTLFKGSLLEQHSNQQELKQLLRETVAACQFQCIYHFVFFNGETALS